MVKTTRQVIGEMDPEEFNLGILEFKTLLTEEAFEISKKMIQEIVDKCKSNNELKEWSESHGTPAMNQQ